MSGKLKPCPFCGGKARAISRNGGFNRMVKCVNCGASIGGSYHYDEEYSWNKRYEKPCFITIAMKCSECGNKLKSTDNYCSLCGSKIVSPTDYEGKRAEHGRYRDSL